MFIDEQDLFNYVNFPEKLSEEKKRYIASNPDLFKDELDFLNSIPKYDGSVLQADVKLKMHLTKLGKNPKQIFRLVKLNSNPVQQNNIRTLAADSASTNESPKSISFSDAAASFLIKVIINKDNTKIYTFTSHNEELNNFSLFLKPSGGIHHLQSNKTHITLDHCLFIESIELILF